jgi:hypothetical protein
MSWLLASWLYVTVDVLLARVHDSFGASAVNGGFLFDV